MFKFWSGKKTLIQKSNDEFDIQKKPIFIEDYRETPNFNREQKKFSDIVSPQGLFFGHSIFHGEGGAGKTTLVKQLLSCKNFDATTVVVIDSDRSFADYEGNDIEKNYLELGKKPKDLHISQDKISLFGISEPDWYNGKLIDNTMRDLFLRVLKLVKRCNMPVLLIIETHWLPDKPGFWDFWEQVKTLVQMGHVKLWIIDKLFKFDFGILNALKPQGLQWILFMISMDNYEILSNLMDDVSFLVNSLRALPSHSFWYIDTDLKTQFIGKV